MNKRSTDDNKKKSSKGFYAALCISAVMIGSACWFSYDQNKKLTDVKPSGDKNYSSDAAVDNKQTGIPRTTTTARTTTTRVRPVVTTRVTLPASQVIPTSPADQPVAAENPTEVPVNASKLENPKAPLADISTVLSPFSGNELVKNETTGSWQTHNGADIKAEVGAEVFSISSGEVTKVENDQLWGVTVTVNHHNGFVSKYCGLGSDLLVQEGDVLASGSVIGSVGSSADIESALAPHLHIELKHHGSYIDPIAAVNS